MKTQFMLKLHYNIPQIDLTTEQGKPYKSKIF